MLELTPGSFAVDANMTSPPNEENSPHNEFPIVGIGASAGGIEAIIELLKNLTSSPGIALVVVQHLDPHHESGLSEILARETQLPVLLAADALAVQENHLYVIPPNAALTIEEGVLRLQSREKLDVPFMPIDIFFRSL